jgi:2-dehydropantoate 2-reductase
VTRIAVFGAGSIGAYVGGALLTAGADAVLIGRARMHERLRAQGLKLSDLKGRSASLTYDNIPYFEDPAAMAGAGLIIVAVKSADTAAAGAAILQHAAPDAVVLSLQNGVGNAELLRGIIPHTVLAGMVPFNVVQTPDGRLHRGTAGELMVEKSPLLAGWHAAFAAAHLPLIEQDDFLSVQWGKLLVNLHNAVNALSDLPLKTELSQQDYRRSWALLMQEGLSVLDAAGIQPAKVLKLGPRALPWVMRLPDFLFHRIAASMLRISPDARSSMWEDLQAGRRTEVDYINGAVVKLAESLGRDAPYNRRVVALMRAAEAGTQGPLSGAALLRAFRAKG